MHQCSLTVIIPSYNDAGGLKKVLIELLQISKKNGWQIIVIDDCSNDDTENVLSAFSNELVVIRNDKNMGYGFSIKRGILASETEWIATMDADGQHRIDDLQNLCSLADSKCDAVIGNRRKLSHAPLSRRPGKWVLQFAATFITGKKIPDINCGLRVLRRDIMLHLFSITSDRFSFSTSTVICLLQLGCRIKYEPVTVQERIGKSNVRQLTDGFYTLLLINRLIFLFKPLRIILPAGALCIAFACLNQIMTFLNKGIDISDATVLLGLSGIIICFVGLLGDQVSGLRRDILLHDLKMEQLRSEYCKYIEKDEANERTTKIL